jgi:hypothetical protein
MLNINDDKEDYTDFIKL